MKKKSIILLLAIAGLFTSCNDAIDIEQDGQVPNPELVYQNAADIVSGLSGVYSYLPGETEIEFTSAFTDELKLGIANGGQGLISGEYGFMLQPGTTEVINIWGSYYSVINRINRMLHESQIVLDKTTIENDKSLIIRAQAEMYALRAYCNYKLFAYFTPDYTNPSGLSILKFDFYQTDDYTRELPRATVSEIQEFILEDLAKAETTISTGGFSWKGNFYANKGMIDAVRTKLFAMVGDYTNVMTYGQAVLANPANGLANASQYLSYFGDNQITNEIIFQLKRTTGTAGIPSVASVASAWYSTSVARNGSAFYGVGRSLYNELDKLDPAATGESFAAQRTDVRYAVNILAGSEVAVNYQTISQAVYDQTDILLVGKYKGRRSAGAPLQNDLPIFRSTDIYLAMAEARAAQGAFTSSSSDPDDLLNSLESVQSILYTIKYYRSTSPGSVTVPVITGAQSAWASILNERRVEFAFEGHRYLDMKRIGTKAGSPGFERYAKDCARNSACLLPVNSYKLTLPIPTTELNSNSKVRGQQNPGY